MLAGMPSPLPSEDQLETIYRLTNSAEARLQVVSFFLVGLLACALTVKLLWNSVARGAPALPRLSFGRALAGVVLWGLVFVLVLTMISGARELMTPGAWKKQGFTYKLDAADLPPSAVRRRALEGLRQALWHFAATHQGRFPSAAEAEIFGPALWNVPETGGAQFRYSPGSSPGIDGAPLVVGPTFDGKQLVLYADGTIAEETP